MRNDRRRLNSGRCYTGRRTVGPMRVRSPYIQFIPLLIGLIVAQGCENPRKAAGGTLPFGFVDTPAPKETVRGSINITGWALCEGGIDGIAVYVDRKHIASTRPGGLRPDVAKVHPGYPDSPAAGWTLSMDAGTFGPGWHELTVQAVSKAGATRDLSSFPIRVEP
jgi:hypothetical protein